MKRGCLTSIVHLMVIFGSLVVAFTAVYTFDMGLGTLFLLWILPVAIFYAFFGKALKNAGRVDMGDWLNSMSQLKYKYAYDGTGIAIDQGTKSIILVAKFNNNPISKAYSFDDVRQWEFNIPGHDTLYSYSTGRGAADMGRGIGTGVANAMMMQEAAENTGLTITVRDIDYPTWFIKFEKTKHVEIELKRWMEILQQFLNEDAAMAPPLETAGNLFCSNCGNRIDSESVFCSSCGEKVTNK